MLAFYYKHTYTRVCFIVNEDDVMWVLNVNGNG